MQGPRIYIESNRNESNLWEVIGKQIQSRWQAITTSQGQPGIPLRCRGLPIDQLNQHPDLNDADGVLLLWGKKSSEALVAQVNLVEQKLSPEHGIAPGLVLYLMPPNRATEEIPAWGWRVLRWRTSEDDNASEMDKSAGPLDEETPFLDNFLRQVFRHWMQRGVSGIDSAATTAPA